MYTYTYKHKDVCIHILNVLATQITLEPNQNLDSFVTFEYTHKSFKERENQHTHTHTLKSFQERERVEIFKKLKNEKRRSNFNKKEKEWELHTHQNRKCFLTLLVW